MQICRADVRLVGKRLQAELFPSPHGDELDKAVDDIDPNVQTVVMRLIFDDPSHPDYELKLWDPNDALTARAEGPRAALVTARKWFYHVEAILREVDDYCRAGQELLTLAPPPEVVAYREWVTSQVLGQAVGESPTPWPAFAARRSLPV